LELIIASRCLPHRHRLAPHLCPPKIGPASNRVIQLGALLYDEPPGDFTGKIMKGAGLAAARQ
jgi:hypothetical protein